MSHAPWWTKSSGAACGWAPRSAPRKHGQHGWKSAGALGSRRDKALFGNATACLLREPHRAYSLRIMRRQRSRTFTGLRTFFVDETRNPGNFVGSGGLPVPARTEPHGWASATCPQNFRFSRTGQKDRFTPTDEKPAVLIAVRHGRKVPRVADVDEAREVIEYVGEKQAVGQVYPTSRGRGVRRNGISCSPRTRSACPSPTTEGVGQVIAPDVSAVLHTMGGVIFIGDVADGLSHFSGCPTKQSLSCRRHCPCG